MTKHLDIDTKAMRAKILDLAIRGKLTDQRQEDGNARDLLKEIQAEKERLIKEKKIKKEKPLPEITEEEKPFEIPDSWEWVRLGEIIELQSGQDFPKSKYSDTDKEGIPYITGASCFTKNGVLENRWTRFPKCIATKGDILLVCKGSGYGKITICNLQEVHIARQIMAIKRNEYLNLSYIESFLMARIKLIKENGQGLIPGISRDIVLNLLFPLPPLAEQQRIAGKVSALFAQLDVIDKAYEEYRELQQAMKSKLLELAIQGKLTDQRDEDGDARDLLKEIQAEKEKLIKEKKIKKEKPLPEITEEEKPFEIPNSWEWVRWGTLSTSIKYGYNTSAQKDGKIKMVRISDIQNNQVNWDSVLFCNISNEEITQYLLRKNDILFARTGGTVGKSYLVPEVPENVVYAGYLIRTRYSEKLSPQYLKYFMESYLYWSQLKKGTTITAQPNCNAKTLGKMVLPLPPLAEQQRIVAKLDEMLPLL